LIPYTWENTALQGLAAGGSVNIETDILGRYVAHLLGPQRRGPARGPRIGTAGAGIRKGVAMTDFDSIEKALEEIRAGRFVLVVDDEERENEGDMVLAAERVTPEHVNFLSKQARGLICVATVAPRLDELQIGPMAPENNALHGTPFGVAVDYRHGTTTGISAHDRAATILAFTTIGHAPRGFRASRATSSRCAPSRAACCAVPGTPKPRSIWRVWRGCIRRSSVRSARRGWQHGARCRACARSRDEFGMAIISVQDLIAYRRRSEKLVRRAASAKLPTRFGEFMLHIYEAAHEDAVHAAVVCGTPHLVESPLVRVHSQCLTGDIFGSLRCDCGLQRDQALRQIAASGHGVFLYMSQEGRGIGLANKVRAYHLQDSQGLDTVEANRQLGFPPDLRDYGIGAQILVDLGLRRIRILTNNPRKLVGVSAYGLEVVERVPIQVPAHPENQHYLETKRDKLGHLLEGL
jgi:3,4-dihydroxy 2-butanone 4-phosphate synthase/GTP cyclohydrolase II